MSHTGRVQWQVGWNSEQPDVVKNFTPHGWRIELWSLSLLSNPNYSVILGSDTLDNWEQQFPFVTLLIRSNVSDNIFASRYPICGSGSITSIGGIVAWIPFLRLAGILLQEYPAAFFIQHCLSLMYSLYSTVCPCCTLYWSHSFTSRQGKVSKQNETCYKETHSKEWKRTKTDTNIFRTVI